MSGVTAPSSRATVSDEVPAAPGESDESSVSVPLLVVTIIAVVAGTILRFVTASSLWLDEALSVNIAALPLGDIREALRHDGHPPLYYGLLHAWMDLFGTSDVAVRALSGVFALLALPLAYIAGRRKGGRSVGLIAVAVLAMSPFAIRYATETRMYSMLIFLVFAGYLLLDDVVARGKTTVARLIGIAAVTSALLYSHYWSMWLLGAVGLLLLWTAWRGTQPHARSASLKAIGAIVVGGITFLPWVPNLLYQSAHTATPWAGASRPLAAVATALGDFGGGGFRDAEVIGGLMLMLVLLALFGRAVSKRHIDIDLHTVQEYRAEALVLVGALGIGVAIGIASKGAFASRYASVIFPLFIVLVAGGISRFTGKWIQSGVLASLVLLCSMGAYFNVTDSRSQSEALSTVVAERAQPNDVLVYCPDQLGPGGSRVMPDDIEQMSYPMLTDPKFVDWVDYVDRNDHVDPSAVAQQVVDRADGRPIFVVWNGDYRTLEGQCEQFVDALGSLRPGGEQLVEADSAENFEFGQLDYFPAAP